MIPFATTSITVLRPTVTGDDGYGDITSVAAVATGVRAVIGNPSGSEALTTGDRVIETFTLNCDPTDLQPTDQVRDDRTGDIYQVQWARQRYELGLGHTYGSLRIVRGVA